MVKKLKTAIILQAREDSIRFPGKVLYPISGKPLIIKILERLKKSKLKDKIITAIPKNKENTRLNKILRKNKFTVYRGNKDNVLKRYYDAAKKHKVKIIVRITADCPFVDSDIIDKLIKILINKKFDYASNTLNPSFPDGIDAEVFTFEALSEAYKKAKSNYDKEHVTPYIKKKENFKKFNLKYKKNLSKTRLTVDEKIDIELVEYIYKNFKSNISWEKIVKSKHLKKIFLTKNKEIKRDEGAKNAYRPKNVEKSKKYYSWRHNVVLKKTLIYFYQKNGLHILKGQKDCYIWDLENKKYLDMSFMGVGTNVLGYANPKIDNKVISSIKDSNMSTLNSNYEIFLAEKLIEIHKWADMVRFARTGERQIQ